MQQRKNIAYYINLLIFIVLASYIFLEGYGVYEQGGLEITKLIIAVLVCGVITVIVWITEAKGFIRAIKSNYAVRVTTEVVAVLMVITMAMLIRIYSMSNYDIILYQEAVVIVCMLLAYGTARLFSEVAVITLIANIFWPVMMNRYNFTLQSLLVVAEIYMMIFVMAVLIYLFRENKNKQRIFSGISIALIFAAVLLCLPRIADIQVKQISDFVANLENCFAFEDSMRYYCLICVGMAVVAVCRMWIGTGNYSSIIVLLLNVIILASTLYASGIKYAYLAIPLLSIVISAVSGDNRCEALQQQGEAADSTSPVKDDGKKETLPQMQQEEAAEELPELPEKPKELSEEELTDNGPSEEEFQEEELLEDGLLEEELSETAREPDKAEEIEEFEEEFEEALSQEQKVECSPRVVEEEELPELPRKRKVESLSAVDDDEIEEMLNSVIVVEKAPPKMTIEEFEQLASDEDDDGVDVSQLILKNNKDKGDEKVKLFGKKNGNNEEPKKQENNNSNQNEAYSVPEVMSLEENAFIMSDMYTPQEDFELELPGMEKAKEQEENSYGSTEFEMPDSLEELEGVSEDSPFGFMFEGLTGQSVTSEAGSSYEAEEESESGANPYAAMFEFDEDAAYGDSEEGKEEVDLDLDDIPEFEVPELTVPEMKIPDLKLESVEEVPVVQSETEENPYAIMFESYAEEEEPSVQLEDVLADVEPEVQAEEPIQVEAEQMEVQQEQSDKEEEAAQEAAFDIEIPTEPEMEFDVEPHSLYIKPDDGAEEKEAPAEDNDIPLVTEADENPYVLNMPFDPIIEESPYAQEMVFVDSSSKENQQSEEVAEDGTSPVITGESNTIVFEDMIELVEKSEDTDEKKEILQAIKTLETSMKHEESDTEEEKKNKKKITDSVMDSVLKFLKKNDKEEKKQVIYAGERFGDTVTNTYGSARPAFSTPIPGWEPPVISDVETTDAVDMSVFGGTKEAGTVENPSDMEVPADEALEQAAQDIAGEEENAFVFGSDTEEENAVVMAEFIRAVDDSNESVIDFTAEETTVDTVTVGETSTENAAEVDETESNAEEQQVEMTDADNSTEETVWESVQEKPVSEMDEQLAEEYKFEVPELPKPTVAPAQMSGPAEDVEDEPFFDWSTFDPSLLEKMKQEEEGNAAIMAEQLAKEEAEKAAREEEERKAREEAERLAREEAERKAREEAERLAREEAERKAREEAERLAREEAERKAREEAERLAREEAERKAREEAERLAREEAERKAREEAERLAREEAERKAREEAERLAREEEERKAREEAERLAREEAERKAREEAERLAREEEERKAREEAERLAREEEERKAREENTDMEELQKENEALKSELSEMKDQINNIEKLLLEMAKNQK